MRTTTTTTATSAPGRRSLAGRRCVKAENNRLKGEVMWKCGDDHSDRFEYVRSSPPCVFQSRRRRRRRRPIDFFSISVDRLIRFCTTTTTTTTGSTPSPCSHPFRRGQDNAAACGGRRKNAEKFKFRTPPMASAVAQIDRHSQTRGEVTCR